MADTIDIFLKNCSFFAYHGVLQAEKETGQRFFVDVKLTIEKTETIGQDILANTVHYGEVFEVVETTVTQERYDLIETLAHFIGVNICTKFETVMKASITVRKPSAPVKGVFDFVEVTVSTSQ